MYKKQYIIWIFVAFFSTISFAQLKTPASSPLAKITQTVGLTDIEIQYSRPSKKGRVIFGDEGLILFDNIWRTGANSATKITFSDDVTISGKKLMSGPYTILSKPGVSSWIIYFYPYDSGNWASYVKKKPAITVTVPSSKMSDMVKTFTISIDNITMENADLVLAWETTKATIPIGVKIHEKTMANIEKALKGPSAIDYFRAASYLHDTGKDLKKALEYIQIANKGDNPRFFQMHREALILADLGRKPEAISLAKKSLQLSKKAGNNDFIRLNEKSIKEWSK